MWKQHVYYQLRRKTKRVAVVDVLLWLMLLCVFCLQPSLYHRISTNVCPQRPLSFDLGNCKQKLNVDWLLYFIITNMATKMKTHRLEIEIDKCRSEENWAKALDLARQISSKSPHLGTRLFSIVYHRLTAKVFLAFTDGFKARHEFCLFVIASLGNRVPRPSDFVEAKEWKSFFCTPWTLPWAIINVSHFLSFSMGDYWMTEGTKLYPKYFF